MVGGPIDPYDEPLDAQEYVQDYALQPTPIAPDLSQLTVGDLRSAEEQAMLDGYVEISHELKRIRSEKEARLAAADDELRVTASTATGPDSPVDVTTSSPSIAAKHTGLALKAVSGDDYEHECKHCGARPFAEGPHHDDSCTRHRGALALDTEPAHRYRCKHCEARPYVAGAHHARDCPRRLKKHVERTVAGDAYDYGSECKHCGVEPFSQGPHHASDCERNWDYSAYATKLAHRYRCKHCEARPFPAGPHHRRDCVRHFEG